MSMFQEYINLARYITAAMPLPPVTGIHLPLIVEGGERLDEFGFVFLQDGSVGPFYTSLNDTLKKLWLLYPDGRSCQADTLELIENFGAEPGALPALALGAFNALSQHVMSRAGYSPVESVTTGSSGSGEPEPGEAYPIFCSGTVSIRWAE